MWLQRRLLIGVVLTAAALAFALVPTDSLRIVKPPKPLFFYLVPLIRVQACRPTQTSHSFVAAYGSSKLHTPTCQLSAVRSVISGVSTGRRSHDCQGLMESAARGARRRCCAR